MKDKTNTPEEILDLVDEEDVVIGMVEKGKANKNPNFFHREVAIIIYNGQKRVLFQQRSKKKAVNPGIWTESCAGHVPKGMTPEAAAHLELQEELGFDTKLRYVGKTLAKLPYESHFTYWFVAKFPKGAKIKIEPVEVEQVKFLTRAGLEKLIASGEKYDAIKYGGHPKDMIQEFWRGSFDKTDNLS
jgi:isopentenyl-diphosphate delta-isomerase type 1